MRCRLMSNEGQTTWNAKCFNVFPSFNFLKLWSLGPEVQITAIIGKCTEPFLSMTKIAPSFQKQRQNAQQKFYLNRSFPGQLCNDSTTYVYIVSAWRSPSGSSSPTLCVPDYPVPIHHQLISACICADSFFPAYCVNWIPKLTNN